MGAKPVAFITNKTNVPGEEDDATGWTSTTECSGGASKHNDAVDKTPWSNSLTTDSYTGCTSVETMCSTRSDGTMKALESIEESKKSNLSKTKDESTSKYGPHEHKTKESSSVSVMGTCLVKPHNGIDLVTRGPSPAIGEGEASRH